MNNEPFRFQLLHTSTKSRARVGRIHTPHGIIDTPGFVAVGTNGSIKGLDNPTVEELGIQLMFCNTYHLMLQPGSKIIKEAGGIHRFINRHQPIITDSGGFQVFSLMYGGIHQELKSQGLKKTDNSVLKINEEGVLFRSYRDGSPVLLTAETSIQAQKDIGADMIVSFDELPPCHMDPVKLRQSLDRTHRWEKRSLDAHLQNRNNQALYAVVHGGTDLALRKKSCEYLSSLSFDGYAVGGSMGKTREEMVEVIKFVWPQLPTDKPNHLLGIADLPSIEACIPHGVDTFDSAYPTKAARHGLLLTKRGRVRIAAGGNASYHRPIEDDCTCSTCQRFTLSYLCHLFKAHELTVYSLATVHNLHFMVQLMAEYRRKIMENEI